MRAAVNQDVLYMEYHRVDTVTSVIHRHVQRVQVEPAPRNSQNLNTSRPETRNPRPETRGPSPWTPAPRPETRDPRPYAVNLLGVVTRSTLRLKRLRRCQDLMAEASAEWRAKVFPLVRLLAHKRPCVCVCVCVCVCLRACVLLSFLTLPLGRETSVFPSAQRL